MQFYPHHSPFLIAGLLLTFLFIFTWRKRNVQTGQIFLLMIALVLFWNLTFLLELVMADLDFKILMVQFQFISIAFMPVVWLAFTCVFTGYPTARYQWIALSIIPTLTNILVWLVPRPNWFWGVPEITSTQLFPVLYYNYQFWFYYVHVPFSYGIFILTVVLLLRTFFKKASVYRSQVLTLLGALSLPLLGDFVYIAGRSPVPGVNYSSAMFSFSALIVAWALHRYKFLDFLPMAHEIVFEKMNEGILIIDDVNRILDANPAAMHILNTDRNCIGRQMSDLADHTAIQSLMQMIANHQTECSFYLPGDPDTREHYECSAVYVKGTDGESLATIVSMRDNTAKMAMFRKIHAQSIQDDLTGIFNRRFFFQSGSKILQRCLWQDSEPLTILAIDIDNLKPVNDRFGHQTGDAVLRGFADTTRLELRPFDLLCRMGGDEFAVILPNAGTDAAQRVAERILQAVSGIQILLDGQVEYPVSVSIGIASTEDVSDKENLTIESLLHIADTCMYEAKRTGGNLSICYQSDRTTGISAS